MNPDLHLCINYENGIGHIEVRDEMYMVSFYGETLGRGKARHAGRVQQSFHTHLQTARFALRRMAQGSAK